MHSDVRLPPYYNYAEDATLLVSADIQLRFELTLLQCCTFQRNNVIIKLFGPSIDQFCFESWTIC